MAGRGKRYEQLVEKRDPDKHYSLDEAIKLVPELAAAKFDEAVEVSLRLGVDPKKAEQMVRGTVALPHGTGKEVKVLVIAKGEKESEAREAGADFVGADDMIDKISKGWIEFDKVVATPDMMGGVGKLGKVLGPRGLMPNPKVGTVTFDVGKAVQDLKAGTIEYRVDKAGNLQAMVGKASFDTEKLLENVRTFLSSIIKAKPSASKGTYLKGVSITTTMGPSIKVDPVSVKDL